MNCIICNEPIRLISNYVFSFYPNRKLKVPVKIYWCYKCNLIVRIVDKPVLERHFRIYTKFSTRQSAFTDRISFFRYCLQLLKRYVPLHNIKLLDVGCSYGYFLDICYKEGWLVYGIENDDDLITFESNNKPYVIAFKNIEDLSVNDSFDVITFIDSLYYLQDPISSLSSAHNLLKKDGLLFLRISNHNFELFIFSLYVKIFKKWPSSISSDARFGFSKKSIMKILSICGFDIMKITGIEKGKITKWHIKSFFYIITFFLEKVSFGLIHLTPGLIVIAKKNG